MRAALSAGAESADMSCVFGSFPQSRHMPCAECGASIDRTDADAHVCEAERRLDFQLFELRDEIAAFDDELAVWLTERNR